MRVQESADLLIGIFQFRIRKLPVAAAFDRHQFVRHTRRGKGLMQPRRLLVGYDGICDLHEYLGSAAVRLEHSVSGETRFAIVSERRADFRIHIVRVVSPIGGPAPDRTYVADAIPVDDCGNFEFFGPSQLLSSPVPSGSIPVIKDRCPPAEWPVKTMRSVSMLVLLSIPYRPTQSAAAVLHGRGRE